MSRRRLLRAEARLGWLWSVLFLATLMLDSIARQVRRARREHDVELADLRAQLERALTAPPAGDDPA